MDPICSLRARIPFPRLFHLSAFISCFLQQDESDEFAVCFSIFLVVLSNSIAAQIFASASHFASAVILRAVRNAASAHHPFFAVLFAAAVFVFFIEASQTQWHISIKIAMCESASSFSFQIFIFLVWFHCCCCFLASRMLENLRQLV